MIPFALPFLLLVLHRFGQHPRHSSNGVDAGGPIVAPHPATTTPTTAPRPGTRRAG